MPVSALQNVEWEECLLEPARDPEIERYVRRELGMLPASVSYLSPSPWVARSVADLHADAMLAHTDLRLADLVGIVVSQESSCRFCYAAQRAMLRMQGFSERRLRQLEGNLVAAELDPRDRAALEFAKRIARGSPLPERADVEALRTLGFTAAAIRELVVVVAVNVYFNRMATVPALPPQQMERLPDLWYMQVLQPLVSIFLRSRTHRGRPTALPAEARGGPFAQFVAILDGLPHALTLHRLLAAAFASPVLPVRTKALIFAVIARGLGCPISEAEARRIGMEQALPEAVFEAVLAHLDAPALDPAERIMMRLARDTIRPRPADIQRRARTLLEHVDARGFVEFVGTTALANAVCRLAVAFETES